MLTRRRLLALSGAALSGAAVALAGGPLSPARAALPPIRLGILQFGSAA